MKLKVWSSGCICNHTVWSCGPISETMVENAWFSERRCGVIKVKWGANHFHVLSNFNAFLLLQDTSFKNAKHGTLRFSFSFMPKTKRVLYKWASGFYSTHLGNATRLQIVKVSLQWLWMNIEHVTIPRCSKYTVINRPLTPSINGWRSGLLTPICFTIQLGVPGTVHMELMHV